MKLSIILTVYNKEPFLRRALDALLNQECALDGEYEVLSVDDGSTDGSAAILEEYALRDTRVRIISQQNQGLSMARNNGAEASQGEYVWFVDADDTISHRSVRLICDAMDDCPDVIPIYAQTSGIEKIRNRVNPELHSGKDVLTKGCWEHCGVFWVIRKKFLLKNNLRFLPGIYHEDAELTPRMLFYAKSVHVVPNILYTVYRDPNSITQIPRPKRAFDCLKVAHNLMEFFDQQDGVSAEMKQMMEYRIAMIINDAFFVISKNSIEEQSSFDDYFKTMPELLKPLKNAPVLKYRIEAILFRCFPKRYTTVYRLMKMIGNKVSSSM